MNFSTIKKVAAFIALAYILIQTWQWYVYEQFGAPANTQEEMMQGHHILHVSRSWLMLIAIFAMMILNIAICYVASNISRFWAWVAFVGYFAFFMLEIALRSVELFYVQLQLPAEALKADATALQGITEKFSTFYSIQHAMYFPLIFSTTIAYVTLFFLFPSKPKVFMIIKIVMGLNVLRSLWRIGADFLGIKWLQGSLYNDLYLPLVVLLYGLTAWWLFRLKENDLAKIVHQTA
ncbi:hypothetical protein HHL16_07465 [Pseudoflavitalea sp. G-6-1-2]|uniref:hypothetical protein n=1 Tax=Pseudoflavitalea sp. G-6-1-2 TaxID=2728841 RepID=UPI00146D552C|nr:hypothetical protein [Pseudoflavitalea sp. G-6-1-2]NML20706.1 hypothetical protein [Pseudoflavitalea sp. G-6-1-2]